MKTNKTSGQTVFQPKFWNFSKPLSDIINLSFNQGVFPNLLKVAIVIPFTKKMTSLIVITTDLFLFYLTLVKFMRNVCALV